MNNHCVYKKTLNVLYIVVIVIVRDYTTIIYLFL